MKQLELYDYIAVFGVSNIMLSFLDYLFYSPIDFKWFLVSAALAGWFIIWEDYCTIRKMIKDKK